jgi:hypothetical protein
MDGGGWVLGNAGTHDRLVRELSVGTGAAVVFLEYDRSPATVSRDDLHALVQRRRRVEVRFVEGGMTGERDDVRRLLPRRRDDRPGSADRLGRDDRSTSGRYGRGGG